MPLTRGSAACGLISIHALLLAAGFEITEANPKGSTCIMNHFLSVLNIPKAILVIPPISGDIPQCADVTI